MEIQGNCHIDENIITLCAKRNKTNQNIKGQLSDHKADL